MLRRTMLRPHDVCRGQKASMLECRVAQRPAMTTKTITCHGRGPLRRGRLLMWVAEAAGHREQPRCDTGAGILGVLAEADPSAGVHQGP
mmetsp:Transcript_104463/g.294424  ORF Transcript_104463/g.294424 Transcript_104463/m.294424 type:complete len:89 (-) Transcript_104463:9-275(-)